MNTNSSKLISIALALAFSTGAAHAVPTLQVGAPAGPGDTGIYADYVDSTSPKEEDTAITNGGTLYVAGAYNTSSLLLLGGQYTGSKTYAAGLDWSGLGFDSVFNTHGAVLMATAYGSGSLAINGLDYFYKTATFESGFVMPNPPSNHDPVKEDPNTSYFFFDIGNFANILDAVVNFASEDGSANGEIKKVAVAASGFDWIHFDVLALGTEATDKCIEYGTVGECKKHESVTYLVDTGLEGNPGSHDATWKNPRLPPSEVPEPVTPMLLVAGLASMLLARRLSNQRALFNRF